MHKVIVHYSKQQKITLRVGCLPRTYEEFEKHAGMVFNTLQADQCPFLSEKYPDCRSMMVGDIIEWDGTNVFFFCDWNGWKLIDHITKDFVLGLDFHDRTMPFYHIENLIAQN